MWNILGDGPLKQPEEPDAEVLSLLFGGGDDVDEGPLAWQERALCAQTDPEAFFPEKGGSTREATSTTRTTSGAQVCEATAVSVCARNGLAPADTTTARAPTRLAPCVEPARVILRDA